MRKIPTLYVRDFDQDRGRFVKPDKLADGCEWVLAGEGTATRKYDGTCVMLRDGKWFARREVKKGKPPPDGFEALSTDEETGKTVGWEPASLSGFARWLDDAHEDGRPYEDGTYELVGPKINGNPEGFDRHRLILHADAERYPALNCPQGYDELHKALLALPWEGIVWHHPDGRMAKLKRRDLRP